MQIRRCAVLFIEPREDLCIDWPSVLAGNSVLGASFTWIALAPHLDREVVITTEEMQALGGIGLSLWIEREAGEQRFGPEVIGHLLALGLLVGDTSECAQFRTRDDILRAQHWRPLAVAAHMFSRWEGRQIDPGTKYVTFQDMVDAYGPLPSPTVERQAVDDLIRFPACDRKGLDDILFQRYTGRNFDPHAVLPFEVAARLLQRTFGAQAQCLVAPDAHVLKKTSPSAGSMHPIEAYVLVQRVEGVAPGLYHYHSVQNGLEPLSTMDTTQTAALALQMVADQDWFADVPMMVVLAARVVRNFWKYRNNAKAHRAVILDAGHLSQTFYLLAAEAGMPAFITAAINEAEIERAFGLDPLQDAVIAVCGCGPASGDRTTLELRLNQAVTGLRISERR